MPIDVFRAAFACRPLRGPEAIGAARRLQAAAHVRHLHLSPADLTPEGWLPWHEESDGQGRWFGAHDPGGRLVAVALKTLKITTLVYGRSPLPGTVEVSGVAKVAGAPLSATMHLYRAMYHDSLRSGDRRWVMSVVPALRATLERVVPGGVTVSPVAFPVADTHPQVRPHVLVHPARALVDGFTARIRAVAGNDERRAFLHGVADFMDDRSAG